MADLFGAAEDPRTRFDAGAAFAEFIGSTGLTHTRIVFALASVAKLALRTRTLR